MFTNMEGGKCFHKVIFVYPPQYRCLVDGKTGSSRFLPRNPPSSLVLQLQTFKFKADEEVDASIFYFFYFLIIDNSGLCTNMDTVDYQWGAPVFLCLLKSSCICVPFLSHHNNLLLGGLAN